MGLLRGEGPKGRQRFSGQGVRDAKLSAPQPLVLAFLPPPQLAPHDERILWGAAACRRGPVISFIAL